MSEDEKTTALQDLRDLMARAVAIMSVLEEMEHRVSVVVEGGRQQLGHLVADLRLPDMRAELRSISSSLKLIEPRLK